VLTNTALKFDSLFDGAKELNTQTCMLMAINPKTSSTSIKLGITIITNCSPVSMILSGVWLEVMFNLDVMANFGEKQCIKSRMLLCLIVGKAPWGQLNA